MPVTGPYLYRSRPLPSSSLAFPPSETSAIMRPMPVQPGTVNAPDFPQGLDWLNTDRPLSLEDLRGKLVLLDFWTYCCINCMHVLPDLKRLEKRSISEELVVVGVHTPKFTTERETENIRKAVLRYEVEHPVVNDHSMRMWREYAVRAWPTLVLIDPHGKVIGVHSGEGAYDVFDPVIAQMTAYFDADGSIDRKPLSAVLEGSEAADSMLSFPGKVLADPAGGRLFVSDSNHNRVVIVSLEDFRTLDTIGSGTVGLDDGGFADATFNHPQGMALSGEGLGERLFVADTENHALREINLMTQQVATVGRRRYAEPRPRRDSRRRSRARAQLPLGPRVGSRRVVHRHGGLAPNLGIRSGGRHPRRARRQRPGRPSRRPAVGRRLGAAERAIERRERPIYRG